MADTTRVLDLRDNAPILLACAGTRSVRKLTS